jgi:ATP-dependent Clp protease adapter protein ClpS
MESIHIKAKNFTNIFVDADKDENDQDQIRLSVHIMGASCRGLMTKEQAKELVQALQAAIGEQA